MPPRIPPGTVRRLSIYTRCLEEAEGEDLTSISSAALAEMAGVKATQLRKDLAHVGRLGVRGHGYDVPALRERLRRILGTDRAWPVVIVGAGSLGTALAMYRGFARHGVRFVALFEVLRGSTASKRRAAALVKSHSTVED